MRYASLILLTLSLLCLPCEAQQASLVKVAIVPGEGGRAPDDKSIALLEVQLSQQEGVALLERAQIRRLLKEQGLAVPGEGDEAGFVKMGKLLGVDLFLFVEKVEKTKPVLVGARMVEAATGVVLGSTLHEERSVEAELAEISGGVRMALAKVRAPREDRRYVAVFDFGCDDMTGRSRPQADALRELLALDLSRSPSVVVLERERVGDLADERALTGVPAHLMASAIMLEGAVKSLPEGGLRVTVVPRSQGRGKWEPIVVESADGELAEIRSALTDALVAALETEPVGAAPIDPKRQAAMLRRRLRELCPGWSGTDGRVVDVPLTERYSRRITRTAWTAYVLDPSLENQIQAIRYSHGMRGRELACDYWRRKLALLAEQGVKTYSPDAFRLHPEPASGNSEGLRRKEAGKPPEIIRVEQEGLALEMAYHASNAATAHNWWQVLAHAAPTVASWERDLDERCRYLKSVFRMGLEPPTSVGELGGVYATAYSRILAKGMGRAAYDPRRYPAEAARLDRLREWMLSQGHYVLSLAVYGADLEYLNCDRRSREETFKYASAVLEAIADVPPDKHDTAFLYWGHGWKCFHPVVYLHPAGCSSLEARQDVIALYQAIVDPLFDAGKIGALGDPRRQSRGWLTDWWMIVDHYMTTDESRVWLERTLPLAQKSPDIVAAIERRLWQIEGGTALRAGGGATLWDRYSVNPVEIQPPAEDVPRLAYAQRCGDRVYMVWTGEPRSAGFPLKVTSVNLTLEGTRDHGGLTMTLDAPQRTHPVNNWGVTALAVCDGKVFVGTRADGLIVLDGGSSSRLRKQDGTIPGTSVHSLATCGGNVYMGITAGRSSSDGNSGFYRLDAKSLVLTEIFSSKSLTPRNALDGKGPHQVCSLWGDEKAARVWLGVEGKSISGLWAYDPATGAFNRAGGTPCQFRMCRGGAGVVARRVCIGYSMPDLRVLDRATGTWSAMEMLAKTGQHGPDATKATWNVAVLDDHLLMASGTYSEVYQFTGPGRIEVETRGGLRLRKFGEKEFDVLPESLQDPRRINRLIELGPNRILGSNSRGQCWVISDAPQDDRSESGAKVGVARAHPVAGEPYVAVLSGTVRMDFLPVTAGAVKLAEECVASLCALYWMGKYEVTQAQFEALMGWNRSYFMSPVNPVERVRWSEAVEFCDRLTRHERDAGRLPEGYVYRLPTEAEWQHAAKEGNPWRGPQTAWRNNNSGGRTHQVGTCPPNSRGLHDVCGNVFEWCQDWYGPYAGGALVDPVGPAVGTARVIRGGSWESSEGAYYPDARRRRRPDSALSQVGFRVCLGRALTAGGERAPLQPEQPIARVQGRSAH